VVVASGSWDDAQARVAFALTDSQHLHGTHLLSPSRVVPRRMARASASLAAAAAHALTPPPPPFTSSCNYNLHGPCGATGRSSTAHLSVGSALDLSGSDVLMYPCMYPPTPSTFGAWNVLCGWRRAPASCAKVHLCYVEECGQEEVQ